MVISSSRPWPWGLLTSRARAEAAEMKIWRVPPASSALPASELEALYPEGAGDSLLMVAGMNKFGLSFQAPIGEGEAMVGEAGQRTTALL